MWAGGPGQERGGGQPAGFDSKFYSFFGSTQDGSAAGAADAGDDLDVLGTSPFVQQLTSFLSIDDEPVAPSSSAAPQPSAAAPAKATGAPNGPKIADRERLLALFVHNNRNGKYFKREWLSRNLRRHKAKKADFERLIDFLCGAMNKLAAIQSQQAAPSSAAGNAPKKLPIPESLVKHKEMHFVCQFITYRGPLSLSEDVLVRELNKIGCRGADVLSFKAWLEGVESSRSPDDGGASAAGGGGSSSSINTNSNIEASAVGAVGELSSAAVGGAAAGGGATGAPLSKKAKAKAAKAAAKTTAADTRALHYQVGPFRTPLRVADVEKFIAEKVGTFGVSKVDVKANKPYAFVTIKTADGARKALRAYGGDGPPLLYNGVPVTFEPRYGKKNAAAPPTTTTAATTTQLSSSPVPVSPASATPASAVAAVLGSGAVQQPLAPAAAAFLQQDTARSRCSVCSEAATGILVCVDCHTGGACPNCRRTGRAASCRLCGEYCCATCGSPVAGGRIHGRCADPYGFDKRTFAAFQH